MFNFPTTYLTPKMRANIVSNKVGLDILKTLKVFCRMVRTIYQLFTLKLTLILLNEVLHFSYENPRYLKLVPWTGVWSGSDFEGNEIALE